MNDVFLADQEHEDHRDDARGGRRHHAVVIDGVLQDEILQAERYGEQILVDQEHQRVLVVVPVPGEIDDRQRGERRLGQRQYQPEEDAEMAGAVDEGGFGNFLRHGQEKLPHHKHSENGEHSGKNKRPMRVVNPGPVEHDEFRDEQHLRRHHHHRQIHHEQGVPALELNPREPVSRQGGQQNGSGDADQRYFQGIQVIVRKAVVSGPYLDMVLPVEVSGNPPDRILEHFRRRFERGADHPQERNDHQHPEEKHQHSRDNFNGPGRFHGYSSLIVIVQKVRFSVPRRLDEARD